MIGTAIALRRGESERHVPFGRLRAMRVRIEITLARARKIAELDRIRRGIRVDARVRAPRRDLGLGDRARIGFALVVVEQLHRLDREIDRLAMRNERRVQHVGRGLRAARVADHPRKRQRRRGMIGLCSDHFAQQRFRLALATCAALEARERERDLDRPRMMPACLGQQCGREFGPAAQHELLRALKPVLLGRCRKRREERRSRVRLAQRADVAIVVGERARGGIRCEGGGRGRLRWIHVDK